MACSVSVINCSEERKNTRKFDWKMVFFSDQNVIYDLEMDQELVSSCSWNSLRYLESRVRNQWNQERPLQQSLLLQHWNKALYNSPLPWKIVQAGSVCFGEISASQPVLGTKNTLRAGITSTPQSPCGEGVKSKNVLNCSRFSFLVGTETSQCLSSVQRGFLWRGMK